jgi:tRNA-specific 2-thiouridylase
VLADIYDAKTVADRRIAHYVLDCSPLSRGVIDALSTNMPVAARPCLRERNQGVKFVDLVAFARELGADCRRRPLCAPPGQRRPGRTPEADPRRDQSYFLYRTTRGQLDFCAFRLATCPRMKSAGSRPTGLSSREADSRTSASFPMETMPASSSGCVPKRRRRARLWRRRQVLGRHRGVVHFTVVQRRGIEIVGQKEPLYVIRLEPEQARIVVGPRRALAVETMRVADWNWLGEDQREVSVKVRSLAPAVPATRDGEWIRFENAEYGVAPGQAAVLYEGSRLIGGGWIAETETARQNLMDVAAA